ncbi:unnamed protein product [Ectocarpus fasciculatus]
MSLPLTAAKSTVGLHYNNWDEIMTCEPLTYSTPGDESEVVAAILRAKDRGEYLKVVGSGLSFSGVQLSASKQGNIISVERINKISKVEPYLDGTGALVEVGAGIELRELCRELEVRGLALPNLGATATQTIIGAATTGTHGTGANIGGIATSIHALRIVDGSGNILTASADENKDIFDAARVGVGAVGVVTSVTLKTVPIWKMKKFSLSYSLQQLLVDLPVLMEKFERLQWSWLPYTDEATVLIREDVPWDEPIYPPGPDGGCWSSTQSTATCVDVSYKTLTDSLEHYLERELYTEMEMFIDSSDTISAVNDFVAYMDTVKDKHDPSIYLSAMIRYVAADDITISPMHGRNTSVMSFIVLGDQESTGNQTEFEMYARGLEDLTEAKYDSRPHWGKVNYADYKYLQGAFGDYYTDFKRVMEKMDPSGIFRNDYLLQRFQ